MDHYGDGIRRSHSSLVVSDDEIDKMILIGTNNVSRSSESEEAQWEAMLVCLFWVWLKFQCGVLTNIPTVHTNEHKNKVIHG